MRTLPSTVRWLPAILLINVSCHREMPEPAGACGADTSDPQVQRLIDMGFSPQVISKVPEGYLVDGDMIFGDEFFLRPKMDFNGSYQVSTQYLPHLKVWVTGLPAASSAQWTTALNDAVAAWNALPNCAVHFEVVTGSNLGYPSQYLTKFTWNSGQTFTGDDVLGVVFAGSPGMPSPEIRINNMTFGMTAARYKWGAAHLLGHALAFYHSNPVDPNANIPGTPRPGQDVNSIMVDGATHDWTSNQFTVYDMIGFSLKYPLYPPLPGTAPLYRSRNHENGDHFYTMTWDAQQGYRYYDNVRIHPYLYEQIACYVCSLPYPQTVPFYRFFNTTTHYHYYSVDPNVPSNQWNYEGLEGYVFPGQVAGSFPLYRYLNAAGDHFYTINWGELGSGGNGYTYEGIACWVYPPPF